MSADVHEEQPDPGTKRGQQIERRDLPSSGLGLGGRRGRRRCPRSVGDAGSGRIAGPAPRAAPVSATRLTCSWLVVVSLA